jgi:hypothetical protein
MHVLALQGFDAPTSPAARPNGGGSSSVSIVCCNGG